MFKDHLFLLQRSTQCSNSEPLRFLLKTLSNNSVFRVFSAIIFGGTQLGRAAASAPDFTKAKDSAARIFRLLDRIPAYADPYAKDGNLSSLVHFWNVLGHKWDNFQGNIHFKNLQFTYPTRPDIQVLNVSSN